MTACTVFGVRVEYKDGVWTGPDNSGLIVTRLHSLFGAMAHLQYSPDPVADFLSWLGSLTPVTDVVLTDRSGLDQKKVY